MAVDGNGLIVRFADRPVDMPIVPVSERVFEFVNTDATIEFETDAAGKPGRCHDAPRRRHAVPETPAVTTLLGASRSTGF